MTTKPQLEVLRLDLHRAHHLEDKVNTVMQVLDSLCKLLSQNAPCDHTHYLTKNHTIQPTPCRLCGELVT